MAKILNKIKKIINKNAEILFLILIFLIINKIFTINPIKEKNPKTIELTESQDKINFCELSKNSL
ncbi:MAG: hypothetical protein IJ937_04255 [Treponema sp.]|nr:hypothetical protein [Treponema sp.]